MPLHRGRKRTQTDCVLLTEGSSGEEAGEAWRGTVLLGSNGFGKMLHLWERGGNALF